MRKYFKLGWSGPKEPVNIEAAFSNNYDFVRSHDSIMQQRRHHRRGRPFLPLLEEKLVINQVGMSKIRLAHGSRIGNVGEIQAQFKMC